MALIYNFTNNSDCKIYPTGGGQSAGGNVNSITNNCKFYNTGGSQFTDSNVNYMDVMSKYKL
jgi:hypothetical protein